MSMEGNLIEKSAPLLDSSSAPHLALDYEVDAYVPNERDLDDDDDFNELMRECHLFYCQQSTNYKQTIIQGSPALPTLSESLSPALTTPSTMPTGLAWHAPSLPLLPPISSNSRGKKCLILDLDETLIHSTFHVVLPEAHWILTLDLGNPAGPESVSVCMRPYALEFLAKLAPYYELVIFTASIAAYANAVIDHLDPTGAYISHRLFRDSCVFLRGQYIKDLTMLGRPLKDVFILDNSPISYLFQPHHAVPISSWYSDPTDRNLLSLIDPLIELATQEDQEDIPISYQLNTLKQVMEGIPLQIINFTMVQIVPKEWESLVEIVRLERHKRRKLLLTSQDIPESPPGGTLRDVVVPEPIFI